MPDPKLSQTDWEKRLSLLVSEGCADTALQMIDKNKLPFIIENGVLKSAYSRGELALQQFLTKDPETLVLKDHAMKMMNTPYEVLICGETGTGKEILARSQMGRREGFFKAVNCAGLPSGLIESELFGNTRGAFTDAREKKGLIIDADNGVMFMDEIGEMNMDVQAKLLRVLQEKIVRRVGGNTEEKVTCKFVFATNRDLKKMVDAGTFRQDLFARISTLELNIKPLRDRLIDCEDICKALPGGVEFWNRYGDDVVKGVLDVPLNVRSLQQYVIRYQVLGSPK